MIRAFHVKGLAGFLAASLASYSAMAEERWPDRILLAQVGQPVETPKVLVPETAPGALQPPPPAGPAPAGIQPAEVDDVTSSIEIGELGAIDPDSGGLLEPSMGGLGIGMWEGTPRGTILRLIPQLPERYDSAVLHDLARRLLLSTAIVPPRGEEETGAGVMAVRVERLQAMGLTGAVSGMLDLVPEDSRDESFLRSLVDSRLLANDSDGACEAMNTARQKPRGVYWEQVLVFCQARSGDPDAATFGANLLSEGGELDDPAFFKMIGILLTGGKAKIKSLSAAMPLHLAMARETGTELPSDVLDIASLLVLRALIDHPSLTDAAQLEAAERAAQAGAVGAERVAERYAAMEFTEKEIAKALSIAEADHSPRNRALLYQAVRLQDLPVGKAAAIQKAWILAAADGIERISVGVYQPLLEEMQPGAILAWFAADAARTLYASNRLQQATAWASTAGRYSEEPKDKAVAALLWPLMALADGSATGPGHEDWLEALRSKDGVDANLRVGLAYSLFEAMGERIPDGYWTALMDGVTRQEVLSADPAYLRAFRQAAAEARRGETVTLALLILGQAGVAGADPALVSEIVIGLRKVGLEHEALRLALEAALQGGL